MRNPLRFLIASVALALGIGHADAADSKPLKIFFLTQSGGFQHSVVKRPAQGQLSLAEQTVTDIGKESGVFTVQCSKDATLITPELLKDLDVVMFYSTGAILGKNEPVKAKTAEEEWQKKDEQIPFTEDTWNAFDKWLKAGHAMVGIHSATDTGANFKPYYSLINGSFAGHPWGSGTEVTFTNHEPTHPVVAMWPAEFSFKEETYQYKNYDMSAVRVLISLNMEKTALKQPRLVPVSWVRDYEQGRLFYTNLGHNEATWKNPVYQQHLLAGIKWAAKLIDGPSKPNPELQVELEKKSKAAGYAAAVTELAQLSGKPEADLKAAWAKAVAADPANADKLFSQIDGARRIDAKKEPEKRTAEIAKAVEALLAAGK
jgi:type 1 glutamine amidotransferase